MYCRALTEKQQILAALLASPGLSAVGEADGGSEGGQGTGLRVDTAALNRLAEQLAGMDVQQLKQHREPKEVVMSAIVQANKLLDCINQGKRITRLEIR